ncbi:MAG: chemotaxis protein CheX [Thermoguttaceae bacterium]
MAPVVAQIQGFQVNETIANAIAASVESAFQMCNLNVRIMGVSRIPSRIQHTELMGIVGMSGKNTGFLTVTLTESVAMRAVSGLLQESYTHVDSQVTDGVGELTNIVGGGVKSRLANTPWQFLSLTIPSVISGSDYHLSFVKGIEYVAVTFEAEGDDANRFFIVSISLMQTV